MPAVHVVEGHASRAEERVGRPVQHGAVKAHGEAARWALAVSPQTSSAHHWARPPGPHHAPGREEVGRHVVEVVWVRWAVRRAVWRAVHVHGVEHVRVRPAVRVHHPAARVEVHVVGVHHVELVRHGAVGTSGRQQRPVARVEVRARGHPWTAEVIRHHRIETVKVRPVRSEVWERAPPEGLAAAKELFALQRMHHVRVRGTTKWAVGASRDEAVRQRSTSTEAVRREARARGLAEQAETHGRPARSTTWGPAWRSTHGTSHGPPRRPNRGAG